MYLTFNRESRELINHSNSSEYSVIHENKYGIVYFDDYTIIVKRDDIDFIETYFDEVMQLNVLVSDQYMLSDEVNNFIDVLKYKNEILEAGNKLIKEKLALDIEPLPVSYIIYMGQLALKNESAYTEDEKKIVFHQDKGDYVFYMNGTMKLFNSIDIISGNFTKEVTAADTKEIIENAFNDLKLNLDKI